MNMRYTAALALAGWYLMIPPYDPSFSVSNAPTAGQHVDIDAPLSSWTEHSAYDTAAGCEKGKVEQTRTAEESEKFSPPSEHILSFSLLEGLCVEADDPRLKGN
jgi:hypothetical protein